MLTTKQLALRKTGIGSSESAQVVGCSPFGDASTLWLLKTGRIEPAESQAMRAGSWLEDGVAAWAAHERGWTLQRVNRTLRHRKWSWVLATPDRFLIKDKRRRGQVEVKTSESVNAHDGWGEEGTDQIPSFYRCQVQQQMTVTGEKVTYLVLFTFRDRQLRFYEIPHSPELEEVLLDAEADFWNNHVLKDDPPDLDPSSTFAKRYLDRMSRQLNKDVVQAPLWSDAVAARLHQAEVDRDSAEMRIEIEQNFMKLMVGEHKGIEGPWGRFLWSETRGQVSDSKLIDHLMDQLKLDDTQRSALREQFRGESYRRARFTFRDPND
jgi:putative phage-type endonuclease